MQMQRDNFNFVPSVIHHVAKWSSESQILFLSVIIKVFFFFKENLKLRFI